MATTIAATVAPFAQVLRGEHDGTALKIEVALFDKNIAH